MAHIQRNVLGTPLTPCSMKPLTGFFRDGCCHMGPGDRGIHSVCIVATEEFLAFSKAVGNDLSTPRPEYQFPGVKPGERWCLCVERWVQAFQAGRAPKVVLDATHMTTLEFVDLDDLKAFAHQEPSQDA